MPFKVEAELPSTAGEFAEAALKLTRISDHHLSPGPTALTSNGLHLLHHIVAFHDLTEHHVLPVEPTVMKNWEPLVLGPAFAMLSSPGLLWTNSKFSSSNLLP